MNRNLARKAAFRSLALLLLLTGGLAGCGGGGKKNAPAAATVSLVATPASLILGGTSTLNWSSTNATACTASGGWTGTRSTTGSETLTPPTVGTVTYMLSCTGAGGTGSASATVTVDAAAAPTVMIAAAPSKVSLGGASTLTWSSTDATSCTASGAWSGTRPTVGSEAQTPAVAGTTIYNLSCTGTGGAGSASATVTVNGPSTPTPAPTVTIASAPGAVLLGGASTLSWSSTNATSCTASGGWSGSKATSGSEAQTPAAVGTVSYTLICLGAGGSGSASATVTVNAPPAPTVTLSAAPGTVTLGTASTLTWSSANATTCIASGGWSGNRATSGSEAQTPSTTGAVTYSLSCTGAGGTASAVATVTASAPLPSAKTLMLTGLVDRLNASGASVAVQHGATIERGSVDTNNQFMVPVTYADNSEFVTVQISGVLNNVKVVFQSNLGTIRALELAAAPTTNLSYTNFGPLHVNSVTTAQTGLIVTGAPPPPATSGAGSAVGGRRPQLLRPQVDNAAAPVQTDEALAAALALLDTVQVLNLAGSIELVALNVIDTPPGSANTLEAASNLSQQQTLVASAQAAPGNALANQVTAIQISEQMQMPLTVAKVPAHAFFAPSQVMEDFGLDLSFNQDGTGVAIAPAYFSNALDSPDSAAATRSKDGFQWSIDPSTNAIEIVLDRGLSFPYDDSGTPALDTTTRLTLTPVVSVGDPNRFAVRFSGITTTTYPDDPTVPPFTDDPDAYAIYGQLVSSTAMQPYTASELAGSSQTFTVLTGDSQSFDPFVARTTAMLFNFKAGGAGNAFVSNQLNGNADAGANVPFTWSVTAEGALVVAVTIQNSRNTIVFRRSSRLDAKGNAIVVATYDDSDFFAVPEAMFAGTLVSSPYDRFAIYDPATVPGQYSVFGLEPATLQPGAFYHDDLNLFADNTYSETEEFSCTAALLIENPVDCQFPGQVVRQSFNGVRDSFWTVQTLTDALDADATPLSSLVLGYGSTLDGSICNPFVQIDCQIAFRVDLRQLNRVGDRLYTLTTRETPDRSFGGDSRTIYFDFGPNPTAASQGISALRPSGVRSRTPGNAGRSGAGLVPRPQRLPATPSR